MKRKPIIITLLIIATLLLMYFIGWWFILIEYVAYVLWRAISNLSGGPIYPDDYDDNFLMPS